MAEKPAYEELEQRIKELGKRVLERKPAEEALIESEELYRLIVENVTDLIWIVDMEMKFTYFSPSVTQMRGYSVEEAMAQSVEEAMTPASFESAMKIIAEELELHYKGERDPTKSRKMEAELTCKDGSTVWTEIESNFIYNSEGQPTAILGITRNIIERKESEKERKRAEEALRKSQQIIEEILRTAPVRVFWKDKNLAYLGCNALFANDAGFSDPKDIIGKDDYQMGWRDQAELYRGDDRQVIESGCEKLLIEEPQTTPEGNTITLLTSKIPLRSSKGETIGILGTYMDITVRKHTEEQRDRLISDLQKALSEVKTLRGFLPICSHCKKIRDDKGYWNQIESYIHKHSDAEFSHGICPECAKKHYPDMDIYDDNGEVTQD